LGCGWRSTPSPALLLPGGGLGGGKGLQCWDMSFGVPFGLRVRAFFLAAKGLHRLAVTVHAHMPLTARIARELRTPSRRKPQQRRRSIMMISMA